jgi:hypothetical protein
MFRVLQIKYRLHKSQVRLRERDVRVSISIKRPSNLEGGGDDKKILSRQMLNDPKANAIGWILTIEML